MTSQTGGPDLPPKIVIGPDAEQELEVVAAEGVGIIGSGCNQCRTLLLTADAASAVAYALEHAHAVNMRIVELVSFGESKPDDKSKRK